MSRNTDNRKQMNVVAPGFSRMCPRCQKRYLQGKPLDCPDCKKKLNMNSAMNGNVGMPGNISEEISASRGKGTTISPEIQREMSHKIGADFSGVKIHTDSASTQMNQALNASAFTVGSDIYFNDHQYNPGAGTGKHLLAHELTHVLQQNSANTNQIQRKTEPGSKCNGVAYDPKYRCCEKGNLTQRNPIKNLEECPDRVSNNQIMNEYDGCSVPWWLTIGQDKDNPAGGSDTQFSDTSIHGIQPGSFQPTLPCDIHDKGYQTCWPEHMWERKWKEIDQQLFENSEKVCRTTQDSLVVKLLCYRAVAKARRLLPLGSKAAFIDRQKEYCNCCPTLSKPVTGKPALVINSNQVWMVSDPLRWNDADSLITKLDSGTKVILHNKAENESFNQTSEVYKWWKVDLNGQIGWVMQTFLD